MANRKASPSTLFLIAMAILLSLPLVATLLNSVATEWTDTIFPQGLTPRFYLGVISDPRFQLALARSLAVAAIALAIATLIIVPAVMVAHIYWPLLDRWMARLVVLPYAVPGIILTVGYLRNFAAPPLQIIGSPIALVLTYIPLCFPMFYICIKNSLRGLDTVDLLDAGRILGIGDTTILRKVILPCILPGVILAVVLNFAGLLSEFVYAKMLVGGRFETLQMYMFAQRSVSGRFSSAIVVLYFAIIFIITLISFRLIRRTGTG